MLADALPIARACWEGVMLLQTPLSGGPSPLHSELPTLIFTYKRACTLILTYKVTVIAKGRHATVLMSCTAALQGMAWHASTMSRKLANIGLRG